MTSYTRSATVHLPFDAAVERVRSGLSDVGFGVITEIDMKATLKAKIDVDIAPQLILGACRPGLAHQAMLADPSIAAMLPCNVVVRSVDDDTTIVEAFDPSFMSRLAGESEGLRQVAADAAERLDNLLQSVTQEA